jgi:lipid-binding SYLF domain-containing protein
MLKIKWPFIILVTLLTLAGCASTGSQLSSSGAQIDSEVDAGVARSLTTTTAKDNVYAFIFDQKGLMAGMGLQGSKITRIYPD